MQAVDRQGTAGRMAQLVAEKRVVIRGNDFGNFATGETLLEKFALRAEHRT